MKKGNQNDIKQYNDPHCLLDVDSLKQILKKTS